MKWVYDEDDLKRILCAGMGKHVTEVKFDNKKKQLTITIIMPDPGERLKELQEAAEEIKVGKPAPEELYK